MASKKDKHLESAQRFILKGQLDRAIKEYQQVVALEPSETRYRQKLAELLVKDNRKKEAIAQYEEIGKHYSDNSYFLKAIAVYKQIQRLSPDNTDIALTVASLNHKQGLIGNALAEYGQVVSQFEKGGLIKDAVKVVEQMLSIDGEHVPTRLKHAELLFTSGSLDASYHSFNSLLGTLKGRGDRAAQTVSERMAKLFPGRQEQSLELIAEMISAGALDDAIDSVQQWLKRDERDMKAWQLLFDAQRRKENGAGARVAYQHMIELSPEDLSILKRAARCEIEIGDADSAVALLERHLPRFVERGASLPAEELLEGISGSPNLQTVSEWLQRFYQAFGNGSAAKNGAASPAQDDSLPAQFDPSQIDLELSSSYGAPEPPEDPVPAFPGAVSLEPDDLPQDEEVCCGELPLPWEEEIQLDFDDPLPAELPAELPAFADEGGLPLDFSLPPVPEAGEPASAFAPEPADIATPSSLDDLSFLSEQAPAAAEVPLSVEEQPAHELELDLETGSLELTLPEDSEAFPDFDWSEPDAAEAEEPTKGDEPGEFDNLQAQLADLVETEPAAWEESAPQQLRGWEEIYPQAACAPLDVEELESHYDLGIGYKEMGMYDGAIRELELAAGSPQRRLACLTLQAMCYREKGEGERAKDLLQRGLDLDVLSREERATLSYELAFLLESSGAVDEAIPLYREVHRSDPTFHDVGSKLFQLTGEEPADIIDLELEDADL